MKILGKLKVTKKRLIIFIIVLAVALGGFFFSKSRGQKEAATATVKRGVIRDELVLTGSVDAERHAMLAFATAGKISWIGVAEGQKVFRGQGLMSLDTTVLNAAYQQALNNLRDKQATAEKVEDDVKGHDTDETFTQKATRTTAQAARDSAYDAVLAAKRSLDDASLSAPFSGVVSALSHTNAGINVSPTEIQVEVVDPGTIYFEAEADQSDVVNIKEGQEVAVVLGPYPDKELKGKVTFIAYTPKVGETGTIYRIKVNFDKGTTGGILPRIGMTGDAKFILSQKEGVLYVPSKFVGSDTKGDYLRLGRVNNKTYIKVGVKGEERAEIQSDRIKEGDTVYD